MYKSLVALFHTPSTHKSAFFCLFVYKCDWPLALAHITQWIRILTRTHTHTHIKRGRRECDATFFFFLLPHTSLAAEKKSISEVRKKQKTKQTHTSHVDSKRHSWKRVQVAMYKSVARRMKPRRALLAPVSACLGVTQQFSRWRGTGRGGGLLWKMYKHRRDKVTR